MILLMIVYKLHDEKSKCFLLIQCEKMCGLVALEIAVAFFLQNRVIFSEAKLHTALLHPTDLYNLVLSNGQLILSVRNSFSLCASLFAISIMELSFHAVRNGQTVLVRHCYQNVSTLVIIG
jgi:hypothetical protein